MFYIYIRSEELRAGMFGWTASEKYAVEYMLYIASLVPKPLLLQSSPTYYERQNFTLCDYSFDNILKNYMLLT